MMQLPQFRFTYLCTHSLQTVQQAFSLARDAVAGGLASGLNGLLEYVNHFLQAAGIQGKEILSFIRELSQSDHVSQQLRFKLSCTLHF